MDPGKTMRTYENMRTYEDRYLSTHTKPSSGVSEWRGCRQGDLSGHKHEEATSLAAGADFARCRLSAFGLAEKAV